MQSALAQQYWNLSLENFTQGSVPGSRYIVSESVEEFTHCCIDPLKRPSMVRFEDAPEHPGPGTGALINCGLIGNTSLAFGIGGLKLAAGSWKLFPIGPQNVRKNGPKRAQKGPKND